MVRASPLTMRGTRQRRGGRGCVSHLPAGWVPAIEDGRARGSGSRAARSAACGDPGSCAAGVTARATAVGFGADHSKRPPGPSTRKSSARRSAGSALDARAPRVGAPGRARGPRGPPRPGPLHRARDRRRLRRRRDAEDGRPRPGERGAQRARLRARRRARRRATGTWPGARYGWWRRSPIACPTRSQRPCGPGGHEERHPPHVVDRVGPGVARRERRARRRRRGLEAGDQHRELDGVGTGSVTTARVSRVPAGHRHAAVERGADVVRVALLPDREIHQRRPAPSGPPSSAFAPRMPASHALALDPSPRLGGNAVPLADREPPEGPARRLVDQPGAPHHDVPPVSGKARPAPSPSISTVDADRPPPARRRCGGRARAQHVEPGAAGWPSSPGTVTRTRTAQAGATAAGTAGRPTGA